MGAGLSFSITWQGILSPPFPPLQSSSAPSPTPPLPIPPPQVSVPELMQRLPEFDDDLAKRVEEADKVR